jgi:hypothetical protein
MSGQRLALSLAVPLVLVAAPFGLWGSRPGAAQAPLKVAVYDGDRDHLWNRLHAALTVRLTTSRGAEELLVPDNQESRAYELDPFLWPRSNYLLGGPGYRPALAVLDEFLATHGEKLVKDSLPRALLQRDLWALFDSLLANPVWLDYAEPGRQRKDPFKAQRRELATRVVKVMQRLALTRAQVAALPDNYAAAVAARAFPAAFDPGREEAAFLPPDLWQPHGPWVLLGDRGPAPLAQAHLDFFGGRSTFFVFLRLPGGRDETLEYLGELRGWARGGGKADPPMFPVGTQVALARQAVLFDDRGELTPTRLTETVQVRVFRRTDKQVIANPTPPPERRYEIKLRRSDLLAGKAGLATVKDGEGERAFLLFLGRNAGEGVEPVRASCTACHQGPGIESVNSFTRRFAFDAAWPDLTAARRDEEVGKITRRKHDQLTWGLLRWLSED